MERTKDLDLNTAIFIGIDAHPSTHTALAINRFEEEKGHLQFDNTKEGIQAFLSWVPTVAPDAGSAILGIEGGSTARNALISHLLSKYHHVYEVNPLYTKQRRSMGTRGDKTDILDAKLIAEVLTKKLSVLPKNKPKRAGGPYALFEKSARILRGTDSAWDAAAKPTATAETGAGIKPGWSGKSSFNSRDQS